MKIKVSKTTGIYLALLMLFIVFSIASPVFLTFDNLITVLRQIAVLGVCATGMTFVAISGGVDLSVGSIISLVGITIGILNNRGVDVWVAALLGVLLAVCAGAFNGFIVTRTNLAPMIITLGTGQILKGLSYTLSNGLPIGGLDQRLGFLGKGYVGIIPTPVIILLIVVAIGIFILKFSYFGRYFYAIGGNNEAARLQGIDVKKVRLASFLLCGFFTGISAIVMLARVSSAQPGTGIGLEMDVMTAVILGGVSFAGGGGSIEGTIAGVMIIGILNNGLLLIGATEHVQTMVKGIVLVLALCFEPVQNAIVNHFIKKKRMQEQLKDAE
ncbi:MAG: ABC transporter permease [Solobacterium sp.]|nr:ABC transporter permease [Solobacterium sp.]